MFFTTKPLDKLLVKCYNDFETKAKKVFFMEEMRDRLREARKAKKLKQSEAAERIGVAISTYRNWEGGTFEPRRDLLEKAAKVFGVSKDYLLGNEPAQEKNTSNLAKAIGLTSQLIGLFAGGDLKDSDKEALMMTLRQAYLSSKSTPFPDEDAEIWEPFDPQNFKGGV